MTLASSPGPYPVYLFIGGAFAVFFMLHATIASVCRIQTVGLNPLELVLAGFEKLPMRLKLSGD